MRVGFYFKMSEDGTKGKDGANGITITGKPGSNDSNIVEDDTQLDNSTTIASNASAINFSNG